MRDIYITPATPADWRALYLLLRDVQGVEYSVDGVVQPPPDSVEQTFAVRPSGSPMLRFRIGRTLRVFHFFSDEEIECDLDPRDVTSQSDLDEVLGFVQRLGDTVRRPVIVTPENVRDEPFLTYDPESRKFECHELAV